MNDSTLVDSWESGARDGIKKYCQDLHVSASEELAKENKNRPTHLTRAEQPIFRACWPRVEALRNGSREWSMSELRAAESVVRKVRKKVAINGPNASLFSRQRKLQKSLSRKNRIDRTLFNEWALCVKKHQEIIWVMGRIKIRKFLRKGAGSEKAVAATVPPRCLNLLQPQNSRGAAGLPLPRTAVVTVPQRAGVWPVGVWRGLRSWALILALIGLAIRAEAGPEKENQISIVQQPSSPFRVTIIEENPTFALFGRDRHYTNGFKLALTSCQLADDSIWNAPVRLLRAIYVFNRASDGTDNRLEWTPVAQDIFTPQDHDHKFVTPSDRPFAGWLYAGFDWIQNDNDRQLTSFEVQGGIIGSWALGRQVENTYHDIFDINRVRGWRAQLGNEFGAVGFWDRKWRFNHDLGNGYSWEIIPGVELAAGNVFTYAGVNALLRWGRGLKSNWGPDMIRPGYPGTSYFSAARGGVPFGFDIYLGTQGRLVAQNIFLDGNTFQNSRSVDKEIAVGDALAGIEVFYKDYLRAGFTFLLRSNEFTKQRGPDTFGAFYLSLAF